MDKKTRATVFVGPRTKKGGQFLYLWLLAY